MYAIYDEGLEQNGAVVGFSGEFVNHASGGGDVHSRDGRDGGRGKRERVDGTATGQLRGHGVGRGKEGEASWGWGRAVYIVILKYRDLL